MQPLPLRATSQSGTPTHAHRRSSSIVDAGLSSVNPLQRGGSLFHLHKRSTTKQRNAAHRRWHFAILYARACARFIVLRRRAVRLTVEEVSQIQTAMVSFGAVTTVKALASMLRQLGHFVTEDEVRSTLLEEHTYHFREGTTLQLPQLLQLMRHLKREHRRKGKTVTDVEEVFVALGGKDGVVPVANVRAATAAFHLDFDNSSNSNASRQRYITGSGGFTLPTIGRRASGASGTSGAGSGGGQGDSIASAAVSVTALQPNLAAAVMAKPSGDGPPAAPGQATAVPRSPVSPTSQGHPSTFGGSRPTTPEDVADATMTFAEFSSLMHGVTAAVRAPDDDTSGAAGAHNAASGRTSFSASFDLFNPRGGRNGSFGSALLPPALKKGKASPVSYQTRLRRKRATSVSEPLPDGDDLSALCTAIKERVELMKPPRPPRVIADLARPVPVAMHHAGASMPTSPVALPVAGARKASTFGMDKLPLSATQTKGQQVAGGAAVHMEILPPSLNEDVNGLGPVKPSVRAQVFPPKPMKPGEVPSPARLSGLAGYTMAEVEEMSQQYHASQAALAATKKQSRRGLAATPQMANAVPVPKALRTGPGSRAPASQTPAAGSGKPPLNNSLPPRGRGEPLSLELSSPGLSPRSTDGTLPAHLKPPPGMVADATWLAMTARERRRAKLSHLCQPMRKPLPPWKRGPEAARLALRDAQEKAREVDATTRLLGYGTATAQHRTSHTPPPPQVSGIDLADGFASFAYQQSPSQHRQELPPRPRAKSNTPSKQRRNESELLLALAPSPAFSPLDRSQWTKATDPFSQPQSGGARHHTAPHGLGNTGRSNPSPQSDGYQFPHPEVGDAHHAPAPVAQGGSYQQKPLSGDLRFLAQAARGALDQRPAMVSQLSPEAKARMEHGRKQRTAAAGGVPFTNPEPAGGGRLPLGRPPLSPPRPEASPSALSPTMSEDTHQRRETKRLSVISGRSASGVPTVGPLAVQSPTKPTGNEYVGPAGGGSYREPTGKELLAAVAASATSSARGDPNNARGSGADGAAAPAPHPLWAGDMQPLPSPDTQQRLQEEADAGFGAGF